MRVLVVEDDVKLARFLAQGLEEEGYAVDLAHDGVAGAALAAAGGYDVIVLDVMLPGRNGFQLLSELRRGGVDAPVLFLTARDDSRDIVNGLDLGADDYVTKPFRFEELLARLRALGRRGATGRQDVLRYADLELDRLAHTARRGARTLDLTPKEFLLLEHLLLRAGAVVRRTELLEQVWGMRFDPGTNLIDVHVGNLRRKLVAGGEPQVIHTVRGVGFTLRVSPEEDG
ncbi:MAG TPA: response regulator transcription factor [Longimicrobiales bacterium]